MSKTPLLTTAVTPFRLLALTLVLGAYLLPAIACSESPTPAAPAALSLHSGHGATGVQGLKDDKGFIDGWFEGSDVNLYYTKLYSCAEPPESGAPTNCVIGADAEAPPRGGPIPTIYAIAAVGFAPDPATLACAAGTPCLNHPAMIDASRVAGPGAISVPLPSINSETMKGVAPSTAVMENFERDFTSQSRVPRAIDLAPAPVTEDLQDLVRTEVREPRAGRHPAVLCWWTRL